MRPRASGRRAVLPAEPRLGDPNLLANVVFPAFYLPAVMAVFAWPAAIVGFAAEGAVLWLLMRPVSTRQLLLRFGLANAASSGVGCLLALVLPSGLEANAGAGEPGSDFRLYATLSWPLWYALSVVVERPFLGGAWSGASPARRWVVAVLANLCSYAILMIGSAL